MGEIFTLANLLRKLDATVLLS